MPSLPARNEVRTLEYTLVSTLKSSEKGDVQLVERGGRLYVRRYREISPELFSRIRGVSCPNVERLAERSQDENGAYFVSEYIDGAPASERAFTEREAVNALLELCAAVRALHAAGIIHRDIKPSNIICGSDGHIHLIDFDSARLEKASLSRDTRLLGTGGFAPPEQYGFMQTDCRSDVYAFGVTMEELLGESAGKPKFRRIIRRCTQFDPNRRYSDIAAVSLAIRRALLPRGASPAAAGVIAAGAAVVCLLSARGAAPSEVAHAGAGEHVITHESESAHAPSETAIPTESAAAETAEPSAEAAEPAEELTSAEAPQTEPETAAETESAAELPPETAQAAETDEHFTEESAPEVVKPETPVMTFTTYTDENGVYRDEFDYAFYDDPAVHGLWRVSKILPADTDISAISGDDIFKAENANGGTYLEVYPNGTLAFYLPSTQSIAPTNLWTNGYYISSPENGGLVCRMKTFTIENGREYLLLEQRPASVSDGESGHRYVLCRRVAGAD